MDCDASVTIRPCDADDEAEGAYDTFSANIEVMDVLSILLHKTTDGLVTRHLFSQALDFLELILAKVDAPRLGGRDNTCGRFAHELLMKVGSSPHAQLLLTVIVTAQFQCEYHPHLKASGTHK